MQAEPRNIVKAVLGRENLLDVSKDEIRRLAEEHPYSPVIQYLLTRKLQLSSDPGYGDSVARTAVYFNNPHWLSQLLRRQTASERTAGLEESLGLADAGIPAVDSGDAQLAEERNDEQPSVETVEMAVETPADDFTEEIPTTVKEEQADHPDEEAASEIAAVEDPTTVEAAEAMVEQEIAEGSGYLESADGETDKTEEFEGEGAASEETGWTGPDESDNDDDESSSIATVVPQEQPAHLQETEASPALPPETLEVEATQGEEGLPQVGGAEEETRIEMQETALDEVPASAAALGETEEIIPIQPLHTQDYFASLGVSLEAESRPTPQAQVQSFTGWLHTMRPVHPAKTTETPAQESVEEDVRQEAEASNEDELILTEAMAEVFAKQGLRLKAIDVYRKLSLLHPDKSSIFAAKIEQLKGISS
jgi:hypothetical protein